MSPGPSSAPKSLICCAAVKVTLVVPVGSVPLHRGADEDLDVVGLLLSNCASLSQKCSRFMAMSPSEIVEPDPTQRIVQTGPECTPSFLAEAESAVRFAADHPRLQTCGTACPIDIRGDGPLDALTDQPRVCSAPSGAIRMVPATSFAMVRTQVQPPDAYVFESAKVACAPWPVPIS